MGPGLSSASLLLPRAWPHIPGCRAHESFLCTGCKQVSLHVRKRRAPPSSQDSRVPGKQKEGASSRRGGRSRNWEGQQPPQDQPSTPGPLATQDTGRAPSFLPPSCWESRRGPSMSPLIATVRQSWAGREGLLELCPPVPKP